MDIEVDEGTGDDQYLYLLSERLPKLVDQVRPDLIFYQVRARQGDRRRGMFGFGLGSTARVGRNKEAWAKTAKNTRNSHEHKSRNMGVICLRLTVAAFGFMLRVLHKISFVCLILVIFVFLLRLSLVFVLHVPIKLAAA